MPVIRTPPGVVRGESDAMVPGRYNKASLIRWKNGLIMPVGGWNRITSTPLASTPRNAITWYDNTFLKWSAVLCDKNLYIERNSVYSNKTPVDFVDANAGAVARGYGSGSYSLKNYGMDNEPRDDDTEIGTDRANARFPISFNIANWGEDLLFGHSADGRIFHWSPTTSGDAPTVIPNVPDLVQCFTVTDELHLMVGGGDGVPNRVAWSDRENYSGWDYTNVTGQAGFKDLEGAGPVVAIHKVAAGLLIFTTNSVWLGTYIGTPYYYAFKRLAWGMVPVSPQGVAVFGARAIWMGRNSFFVYEAGTVTPLACTLGYDPFNSLEQTYASMRVCGSAIGSFQEVIFFWPKANQDREIPENTNYALFNFDENWWSEGELARSMFVRNDLDGMPLAGDINCDIFQHEVGYLANGQPRTGRVWAEIAGLSFNDGGNNFTINQAEIDPGSLASPEAVKFKFWGRTNRGNTEYSFGERVPRADGYLDIRFTAKDFRMRIENRQDVPFTVGAMNFMKIVPRGVR